MRTSAHKPGLPVWLWEKTNLHEALVSPSARQNSNPRSYSLQRKKCFVNSEVLARVNCYFCHLWRLINTETNHGLLRDYASARSAIACLWWTFGLRLALTFWLTIWTATCEGSSFEWCVGVFLIFSADVSIECQSQASRSQPCGNKLSFYMTQELIHSPLSFPTQLQFPGKIQSFI